MICTTDKGIFVDFLRSVHDSHVEINIKAAAFVILNKHILHVKKLEKQYYKKIQNKFKNKFKFKCEISYVKDMLTS